MSSTTLQPSTSTSSNSNDHNISSETESTGNDELINTTDGVENNVDSNSTTAPQSGNNTNSQITPNQENARESINFGLFTINLTGTVPRFIGIFIENVSSNAHGNVPAANAAQMFNTVVGDGNHVHTGTRIFAGNDLVGVVPMENGLQNHFVTTNTMRERLFRVLFMKFAVWYALKTSNRLRKCIEFSFLLMAILSLLTLSYLHIIFIQRPINCLENVHDLWPREGILRVEIVYSSEDTEPNEFILLDSSLSSYNDSIDELQSDLGGNEVKTINKNTEGELISIKSDSDSGILDSTSSNSLKSSTSVSLPFSSLQKSTSPTQPSDIEIEKEDKNDSDTNLSTLRLSEPINNSQENSSIELSKDDLSNLQMLARMVWPQVHRIVEYSLEYGFLRLTTTTREKLNIPVKVITLDPNRDKCFGDSLSRFLLKYFLGYDDILMGSLKALAEKQDNKGYVRNVVTGEHYRFVNIWMTRTAYFPALFIMLVFTLSISMLLRYAHQLIFVFVVELLQVVDMNIRATFPFAPLLTVILALIGMEAIMSEFFNDTTTAFYIILIVWAADQYDAMCCHTLITRRHWLKFFYLYHFLFYAYDYRFAGQYSSLALLTSWFFILHSMMFFLHRYELPSALIQTEPNNGNNQPTEGPDNNSNSEQRPADSGESSQSSETATTSQTQ